MFGYVNADRSQLSKEDSITYQRFYCGLCQQLGQTAGIKGQLLLNYDLTFMAILHSSLYEPQTSLKDFRCIIHPISPKHAFCNEAIEYAACMDILLSYHSLIDKYQDEGSRLSYHYAKALEKTYIKISKQYPRQAQSIEDYITKLSEFERNHEENIDIVSNLTGQMLGCLFNWRQDEWSRDLEALGFYLGKFIYTIDAFEDMKKDEKSGSYNPLIRMKKNVGPDFDTFIRTNLTSLMSECAKSFERLPIVDNTNILRNIIYSGVWTKYEYLRLKDQKKHQGDKE